jgi:hypothetical protein
MTTEQNKATVCRFFEAFSANDTATLNEVLAVSDCGVASSGSYLRGQHIYNPKAPNQPLTAMVSLTVIGPDIYEADRFITAAFAMGADGSGPSGMVDSYRNLLRHLGVNESQIKTDFFPGFA